LNYSVRIDSTLRARIEFERRSRTVSARPMESTVLLLHFCFGLLMELYHVLLRALARLALAHSSSNSSRGWSGNYYNISELCRDGEANFDGDRN
jgi:hypothetical protein